MNDDNNNTITAAITSTVIKVVMTMSMCQNATNRLKKIIINRKLKRRNVVFVSRNPIFRSFSISFMKKIPGVYILAVQFKAQICVLED